MTGATVPWEAFDPTHPDHGWWFEQTGRCLNRECEAHAIAQNRPISPPAPAVAPDSPSRGSMDGSGGSQGLTEAHSDPSQCQFEFPNGERCPRIFGHEAYSEHWHPRDSGYSKADRLRLLAMADEESGSRTQRAAAKAAARAYRLAADMIEEEA